MLSDPEKNHPVVPEDLPDKPSEEGLLDEELSAQAMEMPPADVLPGDIVRGTIVKVSPEDVIVDVGLKSEGVIPLEDCQFGEASLNLFVGKEIDVLVVHREGREGLPVLSHRKAVERLSQEAVEKAHQSGGYVKCRIAEKTKGGFKVHVGGVEGFMPFSQTGVRKGNPEALDALLGQELEAKVLELRPKRDAVFSHRAYVEETRRRMKEETLSNLQVGGVVSGKVKRMTSFGAFVDLGGVDALLHVNDMAWHHVASPKDAVQVGQQLDVKVLSIEGEKIAVGLKQKTQDPWLAVPKKYREGTKVRGRVTSLTKYGAFVEIEPGVEGLIHISEMSWTKHVKHPSELFQVGDSVLVAVLKVNPEEKRISLGYKQTMPVPWKTVKEQYPPGSRIEGEVTGLTEFGAFVQIEEGMEGLIHISDMSWTEKIRHPSDVVRKGDRVQVVVREVDCDNRRISLSLKHIVESPWDQARRQVRAGDIVEGVVQKLTDFGAFVKVAEGVEGLVHISELSAEKIEHPSKVLQVGERLRFKVLKFDPKREKISLSLKAYQAEEDRREMKKYMEHEPRGLTNMAEIINSALEKKRS